VSALDLTGADLIRALGDVTKRPAVDGAVRARAEALAGEIERQAGGAPTTVRVIRRGPSDYAVTVSAPGLFAREFGSLATPPDPLIGNAVERLASGKA
jgi:hypothetical protein